MALLIEQQTRDIGVVRTPLGPERTRIVVRPGDTIRFVDDSGQPPARAPGLRVRRLDNNLLIDGLPDGRVVELNNFFGACRPGAECSVSLADIGPPGAVAITEETAPSAALADGSFLLYSAGGEATSGAALPAAQVTGPAGPSWAAIAGGAAGVGIAAAALGGGGSGGSGGPVEDTTPPGAPIVTSGAALKRSEAILTGEAEAGARVTVRVDVDGNGAFSDATDLTFITAVGSDGRWQVDLNGAPQSGTPPAGGLGDGSYTILVVATDAALNASPATRSVVTLDGVAPAAPVIGAVAGDDVVNAAELAAGLVVTGTAEAGSRVTVAVGGVSGSSTTNASGAWSVSLPAGQPQLSGLAALTASAVDGVGNASAATQRQVVFETNAPGAPVITDNVSGTVTNGPVTFTITFDKPVTGFVAGDVQVTGGTAGIFTAVSASVYTLVVTPTAATQSGQIVLSIPAGAATDSAGNPSAAGAGIQAYDTAAPTLVVTDSAPGTTNGPVTFTFTFGEPVTGFTASDVVVTGATAGTFTALSSTVYTMVVTPPAGTGSFTVAVPAGAATDAAGNPSTAAALVTQAYDTVAPTVAITDNTPGTAGGPVTFTFTFSEPVTGFTAGDVVVTGATAGALTALSSTVYTMVVTPPASGTGSFTVAVPAGVAADAAGNPSTAATTVTQAYDAVAPTVAITDNTPGTAGGPVTFTFTFSEPVTGFTAGDVVVTGATAGALTALSSTVYTMVVTPPASGTGSFTVAVPAGVAADAAGNPNTAATTVSQAYDSVAPTVVITDSVMGTAIGPVTFTFTFSKPVTGFTAGDVVVTGATAGTFTALSSTVYTMVVTPPAGTGSFTVAVPAGGAVDGVGNPNAAATPVSQPYDLAAPTVTITDDATGAASGPVTFTFTFSEPVTGFVAADVVVTGATAGTLTALSSTVYTMVVTPPASGTGSFTVAVPAGAANDTAGNSSVAATTVTQAYDSVAPTVSITDDTPGTATGPVTFTFTFSEPVTGFVAADVVVTGATAGTLTALSSTVYTMAVTPPASGTGSLTVGVPAGVAFDGAGNGNPVATTNTQPYDTQAPTQSVTTAQLTTTPGGVAVAPGGTSTDSTPRLTLTLNAVLGSDETLSIFRDGGQTAVDSFGPGSAVTTFAYDEATTLTPGPHSYSARITDAAGNIRVLDLTPATPATVDPYTFTI